MSPARSISSVLMEICQIGKKALHYYSVTKHLADSPSKTVFPKATEAQSSSFYQKAKLLHEQALHRFQWGFYLGLGQRGICAYRSSAKVTGNLCAPNYGSLKLLLCGNKYLLQICKLSSFLHLIGPGFLHTNSKQTLRFPKTSLKHEYFLCLLIPFIFTSSCWHHP